MRALGSGMMPPRRIGWRAVDPPRRPVLFVDPRSGRGAGPADRRAGEKREISVVEFGPGTEPRNGDRRGYCRRRGRVGRGGRRRFAGDVAAAAWRTSCRSPACRREPATTSPATWGSIRPIQPPRLDAPERRHRGPDRRRGGERPPLSQQRLARHLRRGGSPTGVSRCEGSHLVETARAVLGPGARSPGCPSSTTSATTTAIPRSCSCRTTPTR